MTTLNKVNQAISTYGVELVKGKGYFYFADIGDSFVADNILSVYSMHINCMSLEQWIKYVDEALCTHQA